MRKSRFADSKIVAILHELDAGATAKELGRRRGVHPNTITSWRTKYHGMEASDVVRLRQLEDENALLSARLSTSSGSQWGRPHHEASDSCGRALIS